MKKILSLTLAVLLLVSMVPTAMATDTNPASDGTTISVTGAKGTTYEVTVPSSLAPGQSGTVTATGTWAANQTLNVTCPTSVNLVNGSDTIPVGIEFGGIAEVGNDNGDTETATATVTVGNVDMSSYFGTWTGTLTYNVEMVTEKPVGATFSDGTYLTWDELKLAENGTKYSYKASEITDITIGKSAFYNCTSLTSITIPDSVTSIGENAFYNCTSLVDVAIPDSVTAIGYYAFYNCTSLTSITIPDGVTTIGYYAFYNCTSLADITIPDSVTVIGQCAFAYCTSLTSITIPNSVTSIGQYAFRNCTDLTSIAIPDSVTAIGKYVFYNCTSLADVTIPDSVTTIDYYAFYKCTSLTSITIPDSVTAIRNYAFADCTGLNSVTIPDSVTSISAGAFNGCTSLNSITIPDSVTSIGDYAFNGCSGLTDVYYTGTIEQWNTITINEDWSDVPATKVICSDGTVSLVEANLITFTINGTEYQAEEGMTWAEWVESEYNTVGAVLIPDVGDNYFAGIGSKVIGTSQNDIEFYTNEIIANESYELFNF